MKIRRSTSSGDTEVEIQMTPMIDIVFQLLIFFIMTFKIVVQEGDFNIKMPKASDAPSEIQPDIPPFIITLKADDQGRLTTIETTSGRIPTTPIGDPQKDRARVLEGFGQLRQQVIEFVGSGTGPSSIREKAEAEIKADDHLHYVYVIDAVTHVSGKPEANTVVKLLQNIRFAPPKKQ